jgi:hypothetical protein
VTLLLVSQRQRIKIFVFQCFYFYCIIFSVIHLFTFTSMFRNLETTNYLFPILISTSNTNASGSVKLSSACADYRFFFVSFTELIK